MNLDGDAERSQHGHVFAIELRDRTRAQFNSALLARTGLNDQTMTNEIELHLKGFMAFPAERYRAGRQTARRDVKRHVPPVIYQYRKLFARLAHDLRQHMQRVASALPLRIGQ